jgi:hypothetical protein
VRFYQGLGSSNVSVSVSCSPRPPTRTNTLLSRAPTPPALSLQTKSGCQSLRQQLRDLTRDLAAAAAAAPLDPLAGALATRRAELLEDAAGVGGALLRLAPLLARARDTVAREAGACARFGCVCVLVALRVYSVSSANSNQPTLYHGPNQPEPPRRPRLRQAPHRHRCRPGRTAPHRSRAAGHGRVGRPAAGAGGEPLDHGEQLSLMDVAAVAPREGLMPPRRQTYGEAAQLA